MEEGHIDGERSDASAGRHAGARRDAAGPPQHHVQHHQRSRLRLLPLVAGITASAVAWGYLVYLAIDFGSRARTSGAAGDWAFLALASVGAMACLFLGLLLASRILQRLSGTTPPTPPRPRGGRRAAR